MDYCYIDIEQAIEIHDKIINSGQGLKGVTNQGLLESVLTNIKNDDYYPLFIDKLTHLFFCICKFHCFNDGNKRTTLAVCNFFLLLNGFYDNNFMREMENYVCYVADGKIDKPLLRDILEAFIQGDLENETLQIAIFHAIDPFA